MTMNAGELRDYAKVEQPRVATDANGQARTVGWEWAFDAYCEVTTLGGQQLVEAMVRVDLATHSVRARYREEWRPGLRMLVNGATLNIESVVPDPRRVGVELLCAEDTTRG